MRHRIENVDGEEYGMLSETNEHGLLQPTERARAPEANDSIDSVIVSDPQVMSGTPVFAGTRVPVMALIDYLAGGYPLDEFLDQFPTVGRQRAVAALEEMASRAVEAASAHRSR